MENRDHPLKGKQTPGHIVRGTDPPNKCPIIGTNTGMMTAFIAHSALDGERDAEMGAANAALYAEAHNVANTSGMWPAEMQARIKALEVFAKRAHELIKQCKSDVVDLRELAEADINAAWYEEVCQLDTNAHILLSSNTRSNG